MNNLMIRPLTTLEDVELVQLLREQPAAGVAALYDHYGHLVFNMVLRILHDHGAAEEVTHFQPHCYRWRVRRHTGRAYHR